MLERQYAKLMFVNGGCRPSAHAVILWTSVPDTVVNYLKGGRDTAKLSNRARYIATRPGVEVLRGEHSGQPATKKQQAYIQRLLRDFPGAEELLEYEDYQNAPTQGHANAFIRQVQEDFAEPMSRMENYLD